MKKAFGGLLLAGALVPSSAFAQAVLEEIVVTAQRREQSLQDVPVSVTAFSGDTIKALGITEASQYLTLSPNVSFTEDGQVGARGLSISMRGVSNINTDESSFIQSIGIYLDEFSVASTANATINPQLQDLERVEVLRGPQGTYFGRNSVGGALNLTTKKPVDEFEGEIIIGGQGYDTRGSQWGVTGILNVPLADNFFVRGVGYYEDNSGIIKNVVPGGGDSGHEYAMGRLAARWIISERTTVDAMGMITDEDQGLDENVPSGVWDTDTVATFMLNNPGGTTFNSNAQGRSPVEDGTGFFPQNQEFVAHTAIGEKNENRAQLGVLKIEHQVNENAVVKSISGILHTEREKVFDNDLTVEDLVNRYEGREATSWSTELRLELTNQRFDWVLGFLYSEDEVEDDPDESAPGGGMGVVTGTTTAVDGAACDPSTGVACVPVPGGDPTVPIVLPGVVDFALTGALPPLFDLGGGFFLTNLTPDGMPPLCLGCSHREFGLDSWAAFSDITWHATPQVDLTFGFRYTEDDVSGEFSGFGLFRTPRIASTPTWGNSKTFEDFAPRFVVGYQATEDLRLYANVSKGYKAGGFNLDFNGAPGAPADPADVGVTCPEDGPFTDCDRRIVSNTFDEEILWNYEIGFKSEWFDKRLRLNVAGFYLDWDDLQYETFFFTIPGDATSNQQSTINIDEAEAIGFEAEFAALLSERLTVTGGVGYLDTEIKKSDPVSLSGNLTVDPEGEPLPRSPEWTLNLNGEYRWPWESHELYLRAEWAYRDSQFSTIEDVTYRQTSGANLPADPSMPATGANVLATMPDRSSGFPFKSPDYHLVNLRGGIVWNEHIELNAFVVNVLDEEYFTGTGENFGLSGFRLRPHPRYFGGFLSYKF